MSKSTQEQRRIEIRISKIYDAWKKTFEVSMLENRICESIVVNFHFFFFFFLNGGKTNGVPLVTYCLEKQQEPE